MKSTNYALGAAALFIFGIGSFIYGLTNQAIVTGAVVGVIAILAASYLMTRAEAIEEAALNTLHNRRLVKFN